MDSPIGYCVDAATFGCVAARLIWMSGHTFVPVGGIVRIASFGFDKGLQPLHGQIFMRARKPADLSTLAGIARFLDRAEDVSMVSRLLGSNCVGTITNLQSIDDSAVMIRLFPKYLPASDETATKTASQIFRDRFLSLKTAYGKTGLVLIGGFLTFVVADAFTRFTSEDHRGFVERIGSFLF